MVAIKCLLCRYCFMRRTLFLILCTVLAAEAFAKEPAPGAPQILWSSKILHDITAPDSRFPEILDRNRAGVTFVDSSKLIVHVVNSDRDADSLIARQEHANPVRLHIYVLDADSGKPLLSREWGTSRRNSSVAVVEGGILVRTGSIVRLLTRDFAETKEIMFRDVVRANNFQWDLLQLSVSPTGKRVMVNSIDQGANESRLEIFAGEDLSPRSSWIQTPALYHLYSISDSEIVAADRNQSQLKRARFGSAEWQEYGEKTKEGCLNLPTFVTADLLLVQACERFLLLDHEGHSQLSYSLHGTGSLAHKIAFSSDGRHLVFSYSDLKIKKHTFSEPSVQVIARHVAVYDLRLNSVVLTLDIDPLPEVVYDFDVSPDGSKLAILCDGKVSVYRLPSQ
jgi:hypothetical protein